MTMTTMSSAAIAYNRFGLGARSQDTSPADSKKWLIDQLSQYQAKPTAWANQAETTALLAETATQKMQMAKADEAAKKQANKRFRKEARNEYNAAVNRRTESALTTKTPFVERLVHFWANHFAISTEKAAVSDLAGAFELEAIRPYVLGNFKDLLFAVEQHPAMLLYLDQARSIGPNSQAASRMQKKNPDKTSGLNENLAREILELHTLGVRSGYTQADVTEFARAMTGWSVAGNAGEKKMQTSMPQKNKRAKPLADNNRDMAGEHGFVFRQSLHEPGSRSVLGKSYDQNGHAQAQAILNDLAGKEATAKHLATKLARHFTGDNPAESLVLKLSQAYMQNAGNLTAMYRALIDAEEAWQTAPAKFKTPWEWLVSSLRGMGKQNLDNINVAQILNQLGQSVWKPGSPAGFDDVAATWAAPNALLRRVEMAQRLAAPMGDKIDARALAENILPGSISAETKTAISRAESATTALALLLVSPEFLRR